MNVKRILAKTIVFIGNCLLAGVIIGCAGIMIFFVFSLFRELYQGLSPEFIIGIIAAILAFGIGYGILFGLSNLYRWAQKYLKDN